MSYLPIWMQVLLSLLSLNPWLQPHAALDVDVVKQVCSQSSTAHAVRKKTKAFTHQSKKRGRMTFQYKPQNSAQKFRKVKGNSCHKQLSF